MDDPAQSATGSAATQPQPPFEVEAKVDERDNEMMYRTKTIQFLGRTAPIVLQNENGPCPLLAICNVLLLKNSLGLSSDIPEVSQEKLLSLVAERLIDSNIDLNNRDTGFVENQQQNIADAIDLLPRLTTGIDVNIKFRRIDDFEFTPECAIFDLLDIPLYHGWIVDPQDSETADAIGSKSYNTLMGELVFLETQTSVDFAAATTATLGVPSPNLSRGQSLDGSPQTERKGDIEEIAEFTKSLKLSEAETPNAILGDAVADVDSRESENLKKSELVTHLESVKRDTYETVKNIKSEVATEFESVKKDDTDETEKNASLIYNDEDTLRITDAGPKSSELPSIKDTSFSKNDQNCPIYTNEEKSRNISVIPDGSDAKIEDGKIQSMSYGEDNPVSDNSQDKLGGDEDCRHSLTITSVDETDPHHAGCDAKDSSSLLNETGEAVSSVSRKHESDVPEAVSSSVDISEPIYEGEECILDSGSYTYETHEPVYEGESVLSQQVDKVHMGDGVAKSKDGISTEQGKIIRSFLTNSASQLTVYGLFCLKEQVKERELCVFFRNNHFNTMFKYGGELYILATDQGYISQPDLVWDKLNEVNGDTVFMTGNFSEFKMNDGSGNTWDEQNAMASTADYLANIDSAQANSNFSSDLQLAIALQQQEFDHQQDQPQPQRPRNVQRPETGGGSRLFTGPQGSRVTGKMPSSSRPESKSKDKCIVM